MTAVNNQNSTDLELIKSFLKGHADSFEVLYERYKKQLYSYLNRLTPGQPQTADDIFQQTWMKAIPRMHEFGKEERFRAWLIKIAHNLLIDHIRKEKYKYNAQAPEEILEYISDDKGQSPWKAMDAKELKEALAWALEKLSPEIREVFVLRQDEMSFREIAEIQGCPLNTALGRMQYALRKLRELLEEWNSKGRKK